MKTEQSFLGTGRERYWSRSFRKNDKESVFFNGGEKDSTVGCIGGVLQFFDFHQQQQQLHASDTDSLEGLEAPRNSLELDSSLSSTNLVAIEEDFQIPCLPKSTEKESSSSDASSLHLQGSKTPNLVARLMGLDPLPDPAPSPTFHRRTLSSHLRPVLVIRDNIFSLNETSRCEMGTRSLPNTPRTSSARRSDVDPRLSLQLNKENIEIPEFSCFSSSVSRDAISTTSPFSKKKKKVVREGRFREESRSPRAQEIVKQVKESVRRRVGMDITNIGSRKRSCDESAKKAKRIVSRGSEESNRSEHQSSSSWSPRLRYLEKKIKRIENKESISISISNSPNLSYPKSCETSPSTTLESLLRKESEESKPKPLPKSTTKCRKANCERFTQRANATNFTRTSRKKCKKLLSDALLQFHPSSNPIDTPLQTVVTPPLPSASSPQQQKPTLRPLVARGDNVPTTLYEPPAELLYVTAILDRTIASGRNPTVPLTTWFSPSHPLDPALFHHLEHCFKSYSDGPLHHFCNRRLLFDLADEILRTILKPHLVMKPWLQRRRPTELKKEQLLEKVMFRVHGSGSGKCDTLQDIDGLVEMEAWDDANVRRGGGGWCCYSAVDEEREAVVFEMERRILESLLAEALIW